MPSAQWLYGCAAFYYERAAKAWFRRKRDRMARRAFHYERAAIAQEQVERLQRIADWEDRHGGPA